MSGCKMVTAALLVIGDEILSGRTGDKNIRFIARHLTQIGIQLSEVRVTADVEADIISAVNALRARYDYLFTTGGIGPTHDDITSDSIARAFGVGIDVDPRAVEMMRGLYKKEVTGERLRMARIPDGAQLVNNPVSHTPGFMLENVIVMAGIPRIMQSMLLEITPKLRKGTPLSSRTLRVIAPESRISTDLRQVQNSFPDISLGSYPFIKDGVMGAELVLRGADAALLTEASDAIMHLLAQKSVPCELMQETASE